MDGSKHNPGAKYFVRHGGKEQGPYKLEFIEALVLDHIYPRDVLVSMEGWQIWLPLEEVLVTPLPPDPHPTPPPMKAPPQPAAATLPIPEPVAAELRNYGRILGIVALVAVVAIAAGAVSFIHSRNAEQARAAAAAKAAPSLHLPAPLAPSRPLPAWSLTSVNGGARPVASAAPAAVAVTSESSGDANAAAGDGTNAAANAGGRILTSSDGKKYRVSQTDDQDLERQMSIILAAGTDLETTRTQARTLADQVEQDRTNLDRSNDDAVEAFNAEVDRYNAMAADIQTRTTSYNALMDAYNAGLARVGTPVK